MNKKGVWQFDLLYHKMNTEVRRLYGKEKVFKE